ncbi:MAG: hypothetical protein L6Q92_08820 [Phycisphaerae bacterium]|nr:hypothetical protein [Phycisphaerae bacterium]
MPSKLRAKSSLIFAAIAGVAAGCAQLNNPFKDSAAYSRPLMTTPSADAYLSSDTRAPAMAQRHWRASDVRHENGTVTHWPIWFEDPFVDKGNGVTDPADRDAPDNEFAWNGADYLHIGYGPGRWMLNLFGLPFSAVAQPPGCLMASNGRLDKGLLGYDHDARYARPTDEPPDYNDLSRARTLYEEHEDATHPEQAPEAGATPPR